MLDLFADAEPWQEPLAAGAVILHRFAFNAAEQLIRDINDVASQSPFRQMVTPGGYTMSVAMTNCGHLGWTSHRQGYLYSPIDPQTNKPTCGYGGGLSRFPARCLSYQPLRSWRETVAASG